MPKPEAVQILRQADARGRLSRYSLPPGPVRKRRSRPPISKVAWTPPGDLAHPEWLATGRRLGTFGRCSQWWIGDWVRYGASKWGEKYTEAARITGYDGSSLRNMAWVASRFDVSLRNDKLSWSHHALLAPLDLDKQAYWLARSVEDRLSVADLRLELRVARKKDRQSLATGEDPNSSPVGSGVVVCPECGHELVRETE